MNEQIWIEGKVEGDCFVPQKQSPPNGSLNWKDNAFSKLLTMYCLSQPFIGVLDSHLNIFVEA